MENGILKGKKGIIFGALNELSIAWKTALAVHREGAQIVLTNTPVALRFGSLGELAKLCDAALIPADATSVADLDALVDAALEHNIRKRIPYEDLNYDYFDKTLDISAISFHKLLSVLYKKDALNPGGSVVALTYLAGDRCVSGYSDMSDAKALLQSICRTFGDIYGRHNGVRVNTVSQSPTLTSAGQGIEGMESMYDYASRMSPLGNADAQDCADYIVTLFSDYTRKVTMQNLYHDGGFSSMACCPEVLKK